MKTRQYPKVCGSCNGTGSLMEIGTSSSPFRQCPACHGSGVVTVTETEMDGNELANHVEAEDIHLI